MTPARERLTATLFALTLFGCGAGLPAAAPDEKSATSSGIRTESIRDPSLNNMIAFEVPIPAKWHFQGTLLQGGHCVPVPLGVYRATSPDGLTFVEEMPVLGWFWGTGPATNVTQTDCLPLKQGMSAQDFLKYLSVMLNVEYVADDPVPAEMEARAQKNLSDAQTASAPKYAVMHTEPPKVTRHLARAIVRYKNGTFAMKGRLGTMMDCTETQHPAVKSLLNGMPDQPGWASDQCLATIRYIAAPENQYEAVIKLLDSREMEGRGVPEWLHAWIARNQRQTVINIEDMNPHAAIERALNAQRYSHDQAVRQQMQEEFLAAMQPPRDLAMPRAAQVANSNHTLAADWVDDALDPRIVLDPNTGQVSKASNFSTYTWSESTGQASYQTKDVNANPNGALPGAWTRQPVAHGEGRQN